MGQFLADLGAIATNIATSATNFGGVLMQPPYSIFLALAVIGVGFAWFRGFIGARG